MKIWIKIHLLTFVFILSVFLSPVYAENLVTNGDFSLGNQGFTTGYTYQESKPPDMPGGKYGVSDRAFNLHSAFSTNYGNTTGIAGDKYFIANGGDGSSTEVVWQTASPISVSAAGTVYRFEAYVTKVYADNPPILRFQLGDGTTWANLGDTPALDGSAVGQWVFTYADGKFSNSGNYYLRLINIETAQHGNDFGVDDIYFGFRTNAPSVGATTGVPDQDITEFNTSGMNSAPEVTTQAMTDIGTTTVTVNGSITDLGDPSPTQHGHVWSTSPNPTLTDSKTELGTISSTGAFTASLTGLTPGTTYYVRAYATNTVGTSYGNQESFTTLHTLAVTYSANGAIGGTIPDAQTKVEDITLALATNSGNLVRTGYTFAGWNTQADGSGTDYAEGGNYDQNQSITLYAQWLINQYTITFDSSGGSAVGAITQDYGTVIAAPGNPTKSGYSFAGWNPVVPGTMPAENITLTAQWTADPTDVASGGSGSSGSSGSRGSVTTKTDPTTGIIEDVKIKPYVVIDKNLSNELEITLKETVSEIFETDAKGTDLIIPIIKDSEKITVNLNGRTVKTLADNKSNIVIETNSGSTSIKAGDINVADFKDRAGTPIAPEDITVSIVLKSSSQTDDQLKVLGNRLGVEVVMALGTVDVVLKSGQTIANVEKFNQYVTQMINVPEGVDISKISTAVFIDNTGAMHHTPTEVCFVDGQYVVIVKSFYPGLDYYLISNPVNMQQVATHWSKNHVNNMASRLVIFEPDKFQPDKAITRADFAEYIVRALGIYRKDIPVTNKFTDVSSFNEQALAIALANQHGIISGYPDGTFRPGQQITREEAMTMYARAMDIVELIEIDNNRIDNYSDKDQVAAWAYMHVKKTVSVGVFRGRTVDTINPKDTFTYAEAATAIRNLLLKASLIND